MLSSSLPTTLHSPSPIFVAEGLRPPNKSAGLDVFADLNEVEAELAGIFNMAVMDEDEGALQFKGTPARPENPLARVLGKSP